MTASSGVRSDALSTRGTRSAGNDFARADRPAFDLDGAHPALGLGSDQIDMEKPVVEPCVAHLDPLCQDEGPLELTGGDPAVQINALRIVSLLAADNELVVLDRDAQIAYRETGYCQSDT